MYFGGSGGSSSIIVGTTIISGGSSTDILYNNGGVVRGFPLYDSSGAGNGAFTLKKTMSGSSTTSNFFSVTGTFPATLSAAAYAVNLQITAVVQNQIQRALNVDLINNVTDNAASSAAGYFTNRIRYDDGGASQTAPVGGPYSAGLVGASGSSGTSYASTGVAGIIDSNVAGAVGVLGKVITTSAVHRYGVVGSVITTSATTARGGFFSLGLKEPSTGAVLTALEADNGPIAGNIFVGSDNGTPVFTIADGGDAQSTFSALTAGTMAVENSAKLRTSTHSFTWTNAQVVTALGGAGDITVCTLPAKTEVIDARIVITGQAATATTLTVAVGRTSALYIDYIVASDAKAAANIVYGSVSGDRGTNLTGYDTPSYTGTTAVVAHFIKTGSDPTASTGRVILTTCLLP